MEAQFEALKIEVGSTWEKIVECIDEAGANFDLSDWQARMMIRRSYQSLEPLISLTSDPASGIVINTSEGTLTITIADSDTEELTPASYGVYDIEIYSDTKVYRILYGSVEISGQVTRE